MRLLTSFLFLTLWFCSSYLAAQNISEDFSIFGRVIDEKFQPVVGARVSVDTSKFAATDAQGEFFIDSYKGSKKLKKVNIIKPGMEISSWGFHKGQLEIVMRKLSFKLLMGRVVFSDGTPANDVRLTFQDVKPNKTVVTGTNGEFKFGLPLNIKLTKQTRFSTDISSVSRLEYDYGQEHAYVKVVLKDKKIPRYLIPGKRFRVVLVDQRGYPQPGIVVKAGTLEHKTNIQGWFEARASSSSDRRFSISGFNILKIDSSATDNIIYIYAEPDKPEPEEVALAADGDESTASAEGDNEDDPTNKIAAAQLSEGGGSGQNPTAPSISEVQIDDEQQRIMARGAELKKQIDDIAIKLSQRDDLTEEERSEFTAYLLELEKALADNRKAYEESQANTKGLIDDLKLSMMENEDKMQFLEAQKDKELADLQKKIFIAIGVSVIFLGIALSAFILARKFRKQKVQMEAITNKLSETVEEVKAKNNQITDSIRYAETIQSAILPVDDAFKKAFDDHFIFYQPRDIVSGDFYWHARAKRGETEYDFVAALDCTGHGVPGAFMSMIGNTLLQEIINKGITYNTHEILELLNNGIRKSLRQQETANDDGMDVCLCRFERRKSGSIRLSYTGAKRPLFYIFAELGEVLQLKGDLKTIGGAKVRKKKRKFTTQEVILERGDMVFLTSDGFPDQLSGKTGKKLGTRKLLELLSDNCEKPMEEQRNILKKEFETHQARGEQTDDVMLIGLRM